MGSSGKLWKEHRNFTVAALRGFGFGRRNLEDHITEEVTNLIKVIEEKGCKPFRIDDVVPVAAANTMCSITFGKRFEYTDKRFLTLLDLIAKYFTIGSQQKGLVGFFPWMRVLPGIRFGMHFIVCMTLH